MKEVLGQETDLTSPRILVVVPRTSARMCLKSQRSVQALYVICRVCDLMCVICDRGLFPIITSHVPPSHGHTTTISLGNCLDPGHTRRALDEPIVLSIGNR